MKTAYHEPVLVNEVLEYLITSTDGVYVDATTGGGGHSKAILDRVTQNARMICFDRDQDAIREAKNRLRHPGLTFVHDVFSNIPERLHELSIDKIDGVLFDLGVSSFQIDNPDRGFTYRQDSPLDMRMDTRHGKTAGEVLRTYSESELADIFFHYGEERKSRQIARKIVTERNTKTITTSGELADIIRNIVGERHLIKSLSRIFQALRIEINEELDHLAKALDHTIEIVKPGGRLVVISYHSLEDRIVKNFLKEHSATQKPAEDPSARSNIEVEPDFRLLTKKPVVPVPDEEKRNPRSRSAKLRAAERC